MGRTKHFGSKFKLAIQDSALLLVIIRLVDKVALTVEVTAEGLLGSAIFVGHNPKS